RARPTRRRPRTATSARPLHVALQPHLHARRGPRPRGRRRTARNVTRHHLVGRRLDARTDRSRLPATRPPDTRPALADEIPAAGSGSGADLTRRRITGSLEHAPRSALPILCAIELPDYPSHQI